MVCLPTCNKLCVPVIALTGVLSRSMPRQPISHFEYESHSFEKTAFANQKRKICMTRPNQLPQYISNPNNFRLHGPGFWDVERNLHHEAVQSNVSGSWQLWSLEEPQLYALHTPQTLSNMAKRLNAACEIWTTQHCRSQHQRLAR